MRTDKNFELQRALRKFVKLCDEIVLSHGRQGDNLIIQQRMNQSNLIFRDMVTIKL